MISMMEYMDLDKSHHKALIDSNSAEHALDHGYVVQMVFDHEEGGSDSAQELPCWMFYQRIKFFNTLSCKEIKGDGDGGRWRWCRGDD
ncbi:unnamed protein product [Urochloa humidicola]